MISRETWSLSIPVLVLNISYFIYVFHHLLASPGSIFSAPIPLHRFDEQKYAVRLL
jgi:hypothetical protein